MNKTAQIASLIFLLCMTLNAFAGSAYKCVDADGSVVFTFTPCPETEPVVDTAIAEPQQIAALSPRDQLLQIEADIADVTERLTQVKRNYEQALRSTSGKSDQLTTEFDRTSTSLLEELQYLYALRTEAKRR
jgi:hypothetical protein